MSAMDQFAEPGAQGTAEWLYERAGKATASRFKDVIAVLKSGKPAATRDAYMWELAVERITGKPTEHYTNSAMEHGQINEVLAKMRYQAITGVMVEDVGFIHHPTIAMCGCSPDGCIDEDGLIEIKCPFNSRYHLETFINGVPEEHLPQIQGQMAVTGRKWVDFVSFDPRLAPPLNIYIKRVERDEKYISSLHEALCTFLADVDALTARIRASGIETSQTFDAPPSKDAGCPTEWAEA